MDGKIYQIICESLNQLFYHGSSIQNLTVLSPRKNHLDLKLIVLEYL
jgi:hypothetical protein